MSSLFFHSGHCLSRSLTFPSTNVFYWGAVPPYLVYFPIDYLCYHHRDHNLLFLFTNPFWALCHTSVFGNVSVFRPKWTLAWRLFWVELRTFLISLAFVTLGLCRKLDRLSPFSCWISNVLEIFCDLGDHSLVPSQIHMGRSCTWALSWGLLLSHARSLFGNFC